MAAKSFSIRRRILALALVLLLAAAVVLKSNHSGQLKMHLILVLQTFMVRFFVKPLL